MSDTDLLDKFNLLDKAAKKSDRWWFFALLVVGMIAFGWLINWCMGELSKRDARIAMLEDRYATQLYAMNSELSARLAENSKVIEANNRLLEAVLRKP